MHTFTSVSQIEKVLVKSVPLLKDYSHVYTLDNMRALAELLDNPQEKFTAIHIAGTSGKTSTSYYVASLLHGSGKKVGLTVSPHITDIRERAQINMHSLSEDEYCKHFTKYYQKIENSTLQPTYFETMVAFSYWLFAKLQVDYGVVEVGLGGTLDGTNIIQRHDKVSVITDIGYDHVQILGRTLPEIAQNKAGIIQNGNAVFMHTQVSEVLDVVSQKTSHTPGAVLHIIDPAKEMPLQSLADDLPAYQRRNWHLACAVYEYIADRDRIPSVSKTKARTAAHVVIPGRMEVFTYNGKTIILDGAHNPQKLAALFSSIQEKYPDQSIATVFAMLRAGKQKFDANLGIIMKDCAEVIVTGFRVTQDLHKHGADPDRIAQALAGNVPVRVVRKPALALQALLERPEPILLVTGSFYLISLLRPILLDKTKH